MPPLKDGMDTYQNSYASTKKMPPLKDGMDTYQNSYASTKKMPPLKDGMDTYRNSYASTKMMPPLKEIAKKLQPEDFGEESEIPNAGRKDREKEKEIGKEKEKSKEKEKRKGKEKGKGKEIGREKEKGKGKEKGKEKDIGREKEKGKREEKGNREEKGKGEGEGKRKAQMVNWWKERQREEHDAFIHMQSLSLDTIVEPRPQRPTEHSRRVDYLLNRYRDDVAGQTTEEEEEGEQEKQEEGKGEEEEEKVEVAGDSGLCERAEPSSRKRSFGEAGFHPSDESESGTLRVRRSRRNVPSIDSPPNIRAASRRLRESDRSLGPPTGFTAINR